MHENITYRAEYLADIPRTAGIYAWYYSPDFFDLESNTSVFSKISRHSEVDYKLDINLRYGVKASSKGRTCMTFGSERKSIEGILSENIEISGSFFESLIESNKFITFTRPLYIGIAKNLYKRVYEQHYKKISEYWDTRSGISKFLKKNPDSNIQYVMDKTFEPHSFALETRVRGIPARDLVVVVHEMPSLSKFEIGPDEDIEADDSDKRRSLERLLHLLTDPICGRK